MSLWKRNGWYWADFTVNGTRYRVPLETKDVREAKNREKDRIADAQQGKLAASGIAKGRLGFEIALDKCLVLVAVTREDRGKEPRKTWEGRLTEPLRPRFRGKRLNQITADEIREFQAYRLKEGIYPNTVNHEVKGLLRLLKWARLASRLRDDVTLLTVKKAKREMLTQAEKQRLFETAGSKPEWLTAFCASLLTANTTMRPCELKRLKWRDLDPFEKQVTVPDSKTDAGIRTIPLTDEAWSAFAALKQRADALGTYAPEHYIFHRLWPKIDATQPMTSWRSAWRSLRQEAAKESKDQSREAMPRLAKLRHYDLRHQAVTEMLEAGVPEGVIREVAGHVDPEMTKHYSHPRLAARRAAVGTISSVNIANLTQFEGGYVTNRVTKQLPAHVEGG